MTFDKGNGVILSATWLMPIVLVPGTWEDEEGASAPESVEPPVGYTTGGVQAFVPTATGTSRARRENTV